MKALSKMLNKTTVNNVAKNLIVADSIKGSVVADGDRSIAVGGDLNVTVKMENIHVTHIEQKTASDFTINKVLHKAIDEVKDLLNQGRADDALLEIGKIEKIYVGELNDPDARRRLWINKGTALILTDRALEGAECYLEGYMCSPDNELSNALRIKAYSIKKDINGLKKAILEIPRAHAASRSIAGYILEAIQTDVQNFPTMPDVINELCFDDVTNCILASKFYSVRGNVEKADEYFNKAKQIAPDDWQVLAVEGTALLGKEPYKTPVVQVTHAKDLLEKSWNAIRNQKSVPFRDLLYVPINLSSAYRVLGMQKQEKELVDDLYNNFPEEQDVILKKILVAENKMETVNLAKKLDITKSFHNAIIVAMVHMDIKDYEGALSIIREIPKDDTYDAFSINLILMYCNKNTNSISAMDDIIKKQKSRAVKYFFSYIKTNNVENLIKAYKHLRKHDNVNVKIEIAMKLYQNKCYSEAVNLYHEIRESLNYGRLFLKEILNCLWELKRMTDLRVELENIPKEYVDTLVKQYWVAYYDLIGDYKNAIVIAEEIFNEEKNNANYATNLLRLYNKANQKSKIILILQELPGDLNEMVGDFANKWQLVLFMRECDWPLEELAEKAYCLVCQNMDKEEAWSSYLAWVMANLSPDKFKNDKTAFALRDKVSEAIQFFMIDKNPKIKTNKFFKVLRGVEPEARILLAAVPKGLIKLGTTGIDLEVHSISNKYILLKDIIQKYIFIEYPNCAIVRFDGTTPEEVIGKIKALFAAREHNFSSLKDYYYKQGLPISTMASMLGSDSIAVMHELSKEKLLVASGLISEYEQGLQLIRTAKGYIIDALTIFNIFTFNLQEWFAEKLSGKIYVSQKTKDVIQSKAQILSNSIKSKTGYMFSKGNSETKVGIVTFDELEPIYTSELDILVNILEWIDKNAIIIVPSTRIDLTEEQKNLISYFQGFDHETAVIIESALENDLVLLSDDYTFRLMAKTQFGINGIWLQCLLIYIPGLSLSDYTPFIINSVNKNHTFISFDSRVLLEIFFTDKTGELKNFKKVVKRLYNCTSESAFRVICAFYVELSKKSNQTMQVATILINAFLGEGTHKDYANRLYGLKLIAEQDEIFDRALKDWAVGHFVSI